MAGLLDYLTQGLGSLTQSYGGLLGNVGTAMPESYGSNAPIMDPLANALIGMASLPKRAIDAAAGDVQQRGYYGADRPGMAGPALEAAMLPMGTGAIAGLPLRAGEAVLGSGLVRANRAASEMDIPSITEKLAKMASDMGYSVGREGSNLSRSEYLKLSHPSLEDDLKIRISDHSLPPSYPNSANIEIGSHGEGTGWPWAADWMARKIGAATPDEAASEIAAHEAELLRQKAADDERRRLVGANYDAKQQAIVDAPNSANAARIAELQERLKDPSVTGNQRKKLNAKLRDAVGYKFDPNK